MTTKLSNNTKTNFEEIKHMDERGREYWHARELMPLLGYSDWRNFMNVITKAKVTIQNSYQQIEDHFVEITKMIKVAEGTSKETKRKQVDYKLTRLACYAIAQNGDSSKQPIALAQSYFAIQTRKQEVQEAGSKALERIIARKRLSETEKKFAGVLADHNIDGKGIAAIKSAGDEALFGSPTSKIKSRMGIKQSKPLADFLPTISIKAKDLATEMTTFNTIDKELDGQDSIKREHVSNNSAVRRVLNENGIYPERLPAEEDIKRLEQGVIVDELDYATAPRLLPSNQLTIDIREVFDEDELRSLKEMIENHPGTDLLKIIYGDSDEVKILERRVEVTPDLVKAFRQFIVIS